MPTQDTVPIKDKIVSYINSKGPSLPIHISKEINQSLLFCSAFLSELMAEKRIKSSNMRIGSSPLYFVQGQENQLENFSQHIKGKEREAFNLLKEHKFLEDAKLEPAIRVALRSIKDFAIPFENQGRLFWKYFTATFEEFENKEKENLLENPKEEAKNQEEKTEESGFESPVEIKEEMQIREEVKEITSEKPEKPEKTKQNKKQKKKSASKSDDRFFNQVKEYLNEKNIEILDILSVSKNEIQFHVKENNKEKLLFAYNKKRISEADLIKAYKKSSEKEIEYSVLSKGEPSKKFQNLIEAIKGLSEMEKID